MADKAQDIFAKEKICLQARPGFLLPVRYEGKWVRVTKDSAVEFTTRKLPYEAKIEIRRALAAGHIVEAAAPTAAPAATSAYPSMKKPEPAPSAPAKPQAAQQAKE